MQHELHAYSCWLPAIEESPLVLGFILEGSILIPLDRPFHWEVIIAASARFVFCYSMSRVPFRMWPLVGWNCRQGSSSGASCLIASSINPSQILQASFQFRIKRPFVPSKDLLPEPWRYAFGSDLWDIFLGRFCWFRIVSEFMTSSSERDPWAWSCNERLLN